MAANSEQQSDPQDAQDTNLFVPETTMEFFAWESATRDTIDFKKVYADMAEDTVTGLLLSQIVFWHLPNTDGGEKLRIEKHGRMWLAKARHEWWKEARLSPRQIDRCKAQLQKKGICRIEVWKFNGAPTDHYSLNMAVFLKLLKAVIEHPASRPYGSNKFGNHQMVKSKSPVGEVKIHQNATSSIQRLHTEITYRDIGDSLPFVTTPPFPNTKPAEDRQKRIEAKRKKLKSQAIMLGLESDEIN